MNKRVHTPILPAEQRELPGGFEWAVYRVIHAMPDDTVDGWKVMLTHGGTKCIEVIHRDLQLAKSIALDAAAELWPAQFKGVK